MRKFLERCGFLLETILRKHKIIQEKNRDTALYVILNSEWHEVGPRLRKYIGYGAKIVQKAADLDMSIIPKISVKVKTDGVRDGINIAAQRFIGATDEGIVDSKKKRRRKKKKAIVFCDVTTDSDSN